jgi:hypothetical protein
VFWDTGLVETFAADDGEGYPTPPYLWHVFRPPWLDEADSWQPREHLRSVLTDVSGPLAGRARKRLTPAEVRCGVVNELPWAVDDRALEAVAVFELEGLVDRTLAAPRAELLLSMLNDLVVREFGIAADLGPRFDGALEKYGILDVEMSAPPCAPGSPMVIGVVAKVERIGDVELNGTADWIMQRESRDLRLLPATALIRSATYANVRGLHFGAGFYA